MKTLFDKKEQELDNHYRTYDILEYPREFIIRSVIKGFEDFELQAPSKTTNYFDLVNLLNEGTSALNKCIEWAFTNTNTSDLTNFDIEEKECERITSEYFAWGYYYSILESFHISFRRNMSKVEVDEKQKIIHFKLLPKESLHFSIQQSLTSNESNLDKLKNIPDDELEKEYRSIISQQLVDKYLLFYQNLIFPELPLQFNFDGYTREDFIKFWISMYFTFRRYVFIKREKGSSDTYSRNKEEFIEICKRLISENSVISILNDLTFKPKNNIGITKCPFILSDDRYYFSPSLITSLDPNLMLIGALNKTSKKYIYDNAVNTIEQYWTDKIYSILSQVSSFKVNYKRTYRNNSVIITPDFVVSDVINRELVIIEYKHFVKSTKTSETINKQKAVQEANEQVLKYKKYFLENTREYRGINTKDYTIIPVILFNEPISLSYINGNVKYCNYWNLKKHLRNELSFSEFLEKSNPLKMQGNLDIENFKIFENRVKMKDWTYIYESMSI